MSPEYESSWEHLSGEERRKKIATHISDMRIGHRVLEERHAQLEAIQDFEARTYQLDAFNALWTARRDSADRGLIHLATGLGKTSVAVVDYAAFRQEQIERTGREPRALFVVHQNNILLQASERFAELMPDVSRSLYSNRQKNLPESGVTFSSFQTLSNGAHRFPNDYFDYIIYDEAHHIEAKTYKKVVEYFKPQFQLGLTATPERMDEKDITDHFGEALYTKTLPEAIAEKHLATVNYNIVFDDAVKEAMQNDFEPSSLAEIQRLFEVQPRNEIIVEKIRDAQELIRREQGIERVKTIIFCADLEHANTIADMMGGESYHSGKDRAQQAALLDAFRGDGLETITVRDMFNEGVDVPDARLVVFLRTTQSATIFEQQLGRGLRKSRNKQEVTVLDFVANIERIALIRELADSVDNLNTRAGTRIGDGDKRGDDTAPGFDESLKIHSEDSEFIFSEEIIDLLEKYKQRKEDQESIADAPEGVISLASYAVKDLGVSPQTLRNAFRQASVELPIYKFGIVTGQGLDKEARTLAQHLTSNISRTDAASLGVKSVLAFGAEIGISKDYFYKILKERGIIPQKYKFYTSTADGLTPEEQEIILSDTSIIKRPPEGVVSINAFAKKIGTNFTAVKKIIQNNSIDLPRYKFGPKEAEGLDLNAQEQIISILNDKPKIAPDGYMSVTGFGKSVGKDTKSINRIIKIVGEELKFEKTKLYIFSDRGSGVAVPGLSPAQQDILKTHLKL